MSNQVALITGGATGIGKAVRLKLVAKGVTVVMSGRPERLPIESRLLRANLDLREPSSSLLEVELPARPPGPRLMRGVDGGLNSPVGVALPAFTLIVEDTELLEDAIRAAASLGG